MCWQYYCTVDKFERVAQAVAAMDLVTCSQRKLVEVCVVQGEDNDGDRHLQRCAAQVTVTTFALHLGDGHELQQLTHFSSK
jgi:hypothetical protein